MRQITVSNEYLSKILNRMIISLPAMSRKYNNTKMLEDFYSQVFNGTPLTVPQKRTVFQVYNNYFVKKSQCGFNDEIQDRQDWKEKGAVTFEIKPADQIPDWYMVQNGTTPKLKEVKEEKKYRIVRPHPVRKILTDNTPKNVDVPQRVYNEAADIVNDLTVVFCKELAKRHDGKRIPESEVRMAFLETIRNYR